MNFENKTACISPVKMNSNSSFKFRCHSGIECFTLCCRGINITLTPYDVIRLKKRVDLSSHDFLAIYTKPKLLEKTDLPMVNLKLLDDEVNSCPFVKDSEGCIVYEDRPTSCRYYPLGSGILQHKDGADDNNFFFFVNEPHCKGFSQKKEWSVAEWCKNQGLTNGNKIDEQWADIVVRKRSFPSNIKLTEQAKQMFFLASYDIDKFRSFVFDTSFLKRFDISNQMKEKIRDNEIELLEFGLTWLKKILFQDKSNKLA